MADYFEKIPLFSKATYILVRLIGDDYLPIMKVGKEVIALKNAATLSVIGFVE